MSTDQDTKDTETELQAILNRLTAESAAAQALDVTIKKFGDDVDALDTHVTASKKDIAVFMEEQGKELDALIAEEQKDMDADKAEPEEPEET